jgi:hypothetical protein
LNGLTDIDKGLARQGERQGRTLPHGALDKRTV